MFSIYQTVLPYRYKFTFYPAFLISPVDCCKSFKNYSAMIKYLYALSQNGRYLNLNTHL